MLCYVLEWHGMLGYVMFSMLCYVMLCYGMYVCMYGKVVFCYGMYVCYAMLLYGMVL